VSALPPLSSPVWELAYPAAASSLAAGSSSSGPAGVERINSGPALAGGMTGAWYSSGYGSVDSGVPAWLGVYLTQWPASAS
jgi:hypothetical protein